MIPYGRQDIWQEDIDAVVSVLRSDFLTQGPVVPKFEQAIANYCGVDHAIAVNSATSALHIACLALELGAGDWLWTSPITFVASANCGLYCNASIDFVDINPKTFNICTDALELKLNQAAIENKLPKILVVVNLCGQPCDMKAIFELSKRFKFNIIEDASHAIGGRYDGEPIGNCRYSDISIFSFHPVKIITSGEGGMALTNRAYLAEKMLLLRSHGITRDANRMSHKPDGPWYYEQISLGFNYRMTELQAALGLSQLSRLDQYVAHRHTLARRYDELLKSLPLKIPYQASYSYSGMHLYVIRLELGKIKKTQSQVFEDLRQNGIGVNLHYIPVHTHIYYKNLGFNEEDFPNAMEYYKEAISIPLFHGMSDLQQDTVISILKTTLNS